MATRRQQLEVLRLLPLDDQCPYCGGIEIFDISQADTLGLDCERTNAPCSHLTINALAACQMYENLTQSLGARLKAWWKQFVKNHIVDDYPYDDEM